MNKSGLLGKRIPTLVGLLILIGGLIAGVFLVSQRQGLGTSAGPTESPKNVRVTNRGTNTFSVSWTTDTPTTGFVKYSENPARITTPAGDVRDQISGSAQSYTNHYVNITGLSADTTYYFVIGSGPQTYNDDGKPFQIRTGPQVIPPPEDVINGVIVSGSATPVNGAIVYVEAEGGEALSTTTKVDGTWRLNLASSRDKAGQGLTYDKDQTILSIFVQAGTGGTATAITNTSTDSPVNDIVMGKNQSFVETLPQPITDASGTDTQGFGSLEAAPTQAIEVQLSEEATASVKVLNPAINGEMIATSSPELRGTAVPGTDIRITVESDPQSALIKADASGNWTWTPPLALEPGIHTITIQYTEAGGLQATIERTFTVLAYEDAGGLPAFTATPSAATPTVTPTATPTTEATLMGTLEITPTPTDVIPTPTPLEEFVMPATESGELAETGGELLTVLLIGGGVALLITGRLTKRWTDKNTQND